VTLSICGIFKEVMTISAAAIIFDDPLTPVNISGLLVTIVSIAAYNYMKISKMRREAVEATHRRERDRASVIAPTGYAEYSDDGQVPQMSPARPLSAAENESSSPGRMGIHVGESATSMAVPRFGGQSANTSATNLSVFSVSSNVSATNLSVFSGSAIA